MFEKIKKYGFKKAVLLSLSVIGDMLGIHVMKMHYLRLNTDIDIVKKQLSGFDLEVRELNYDDFYKGDHNVFNGIKMDLYKDRILDDGYYCYGIFENDKLIYSTWFSVNKLGLPVTKKKYQLQPNEGLLEDSYCFPAARGRGFHSKMNFFRIKKLYELGKNRVIVILLDGNEPAMKVQVKSGFEELGVFYVGSFWGWKFCTLSKDKFDKM